MSYAFGQNDLCSIDELWSAEVGGCVPMNCGIGRKAVYGSCVDDPDACPDGMYFDQVIGECMLKPPPGPAPSQPSGKSAAKPVPVATAGIGFGTVAIAAAAVVGSIYLWSGR